MDKDVDIGRIGENIVTNEFLARGFLVTHLDKGTRGVSANSDPLVGHPRLERPVLVQVKTGYAGRTPNWIFVGSCSERVLAGDEPLYNRKPGFKADVLAAVALTDPRSSRCFIVPIQKAEEIVLTAFRGWHHHPTRSGQQRKAVPKMYIPVGLETLRTRAGPESHPQPTGR